MALQDFVGEFLTFLENREEKLLSWGFHQVQSSGTELENALLYDAPLELQDQWAELQKQGVTFRTLLREMHLNNLLYRLPDDPSMYRTRMAEGVRLIANLRQYFSPNNWATGPKLVSDIKLHLKERVYPRRDIPIDKVWGDTLKNVSGGGESFLTQCFEEMAWDPKRKKHYSFSGFQKRAFVGILEAVEERLHTGSVICAGTGSGKTKAFYVPALLKVANEIRKNPREGVKVIAIYPRNVLLADQLKEAISEAQKISPILAKEGVRPITFGALLGSTPKADWFDTPRPQRWHWKASQSGGHIIPYLKSPVDGVSDLIWMQKDRSAKKTSLYRVGKSVPDVDDGVLRITREQLVSNPPDVLFLSLEMLNRELGNPIFKRLFGLQQGKFSPCLVLLDEVHTYEGLSGAQAAWVLRRWKFWVFAGQKVLPPHFVGLSATLRNAPEHLAKVCGLSPEKVVEYSPIDALGENSEMETEGQEYNLAIKGDPSSGTALLSTTIQTGMLLARLLTPKSKAIPPSPSGLNGSDFYSKKVFGFTDNLDSLNRWFSDMNHAEFMKLARLRDVPNPLPPRGEYQRRIDEGQVWDLPCRLGYNLSQSLDITRCSSQDPGVNTYSDLVIATSSLEVGFDDPDVGMVIHHKAPGSMSSFIQRRGRAGRTRGSRPLTAVILSDYGRDRWAFQSAERLFEPEIDNIQLPITNPYVLRVQLAYFLIDWLGQTTGCPRSPYWYLASTSNSYVAKTHKDVAHRLNSLLNLSGQEWASFGSSAVRMYSHGRGLYNGSCEQSAEQLQDELNDILWEEPRPLLTEVIPSLLRKLEVNWVKSGVNVEIEDRGIKRPIPQYIPAATFSELDLNEACLELSDYQSTSKDDEFLSMPQFYRECCPGRVSKRYSTLVNRRPPEPGYWHVYSSSLTSGVNVASCADLFSDVRSLGKVGGVAVYRPNHARIEHIPDGILESSSSSWNWEIDANIRNFNNATPLPVKGHKPWNKIFDSAVALLHVNKSWVNLLRYAHSCEFEVRKEKVNPIQGELNLESKSGVPEAIGFRLKADGLFFHISSKYIKNAPAMDAREIELVRYEYFLHKLKQSKTLCDLLNPFQIEWMAQVSIAMLCATALSCRISLKQAQAKLSSNRSSAASKVLETIFQVRGVTPTGQVEEGKLKTALLNFWADQNIASEIIKYESVLWNQLSGSDFDQWIQDRCVATLAQALKVGASYVSDQISEDDLVVDVINSSGDCRIFITEKSSGGLGIIELVVNKINDDPRFFLDAVESALKECPREKWAYNLTATCKKAAVGQEDGHGEIVAAFNLVRQAKRLSDLELAKNSLTSALCEVGMNSGRANVAAVTMKLLRPGTSSHTDRLTYALNTLWRRKSGRLGIEIPLRTFAYVASSYLPSKRRIHFLLRQSFQKIPTPSQLYAIVQQLLFDGCLDSCPDCLNNPNSFNDFGKPFRSIALKWLSLDSSVVSVDKGNKWVKDAITRLVNNGRVILRSPVRMKDELIGGLVPLFFEELSGKYYSESVYISCVETSGGMVSVTLSVRNFTNV